MRRNRQKEKTPDASGHMAAAPGVCCYLFVLVCEIEFLAVIVRIRHTFQLGKGLLGQRPHIPVHTRHGCGDLTYRPASVCVVVHMPRKWVDSLFEELIIHKKDNQNYLDNFLKVWQKCGLLADRKKKSTETQQCAEFRCFVLVTRTGIELFILHFYSLFCFS